MQAIKRDLFPILEDKTYLNTCSIGALSIQVKTAVNAFMDQWNSEGGLSWIMDGGWTDTVEQARSEFAKIIGAKPENIAYSFGNSVAVSSISSSLNYDTRNEVIFSELDFPSSPTHFMAKSEYGLDYKVVKSKDNMTVALDDYRQLITDKTRMIAACEVVSNTGFRINTDELIELSHEKEVPVLLDTYQSTGYIPMDVKKNDLDFLVSGCLKWLVGGFGISFLYIRDDWMEKLVPGNIGWMGVDDPFADLYDKLRTELHRPSDARKFQHGTPYPFGAITALQGMKLIQEIGIDLIFEHNMKISQEIIDKAQDSGFETLTPVEKSERGSIVNIQVPDAHEVVTSLQNQGFILDMRANGVRTSPHFYNNSEDVDRLLDNIKARMT
ncbi:MAG: aminotransferase class V-fold PLP-dependent enzyme [Candidatus Kariarchaeaceae archaeon]|jgi:selenocysteine lyase/cysteine desulfurase